ncbi:MAG: HD domain-containing protein [bacterium]|nr:HD domain-containing protein [bacterium]
MNVVDKAKEFVIKAHNGQVRKTEKDKPMIVHLFDVASILKQYEFDDNVIAAGFLHDTLEDTKVTKEDILNNFNEDILSLILGDTEVDKTLSWKERKTITINEAKALDLRHKSIIIADKISNLEDMLIYFNKLGKKDFSAFNQGFEEQKWYFENLYQSLILNENEDKEYFQRLKSLIDEIFNNKEDEFLRNTIFKNKEQEFIEVKKLDAKKWELAKLKRLFDIDSYTIEFTGTPRTGKTTLINNLYDFFKKGKFKTSILEEFTTSKRYKEQIYPKLKNEYKNIVNTEIPKYVLKDLEEEQAKDLDVILIDRSLFDRIIWVDRLRLKGGMSEEEYEDYLNTYIPLVNEKIDIVIALKTDAITALKRDYNANLSLEKRNFLNEDNVNEYNISLENTLKLFENKAYVFDTTNKSQRETSIEVANKILDNYRTKVINIINNQIKNTLKEK